MQEINSLPSQLQTSEPATSVHINSYIDILQVLHSALYYQLFVNYLSTTNFFFTLKGKKDVMDLLDAKLDG